VECERPAAIAETTATKFLDQVVKQIAITEKNALEYEEVAKENYRLAEAEERSRNENLALREQIECTSMFESISAPPQHCTVCCSYSTVTDLAKLRGWSTSQPRRTAM
jgi:hypothetical protein